MLQRLTDYSAFEKRGAMFQVHCNLSFYLRRITLNDENMSPEHVCIEMMYAML